MSPSGAAFAQVAAAAPLRVMEGPEREARMETALQSQRLARRVQAPWESRAAVPQARKAEEGRISPRL
jgi:hypothetical protein